MSDCHGWNTVAYVAANEVNSNSEKREEWNIMEWQDKRVLVFGTGVSGIGAAELLEKVQAQPVLYDGNQNLTE